MEAAAKSTVGAADCAQKKLQKKVCLFFAHAYLYLTL